MRIPGDPQEGLVPKASITNPEKDARAEDRAVHYNPEIASKLYSHESSPRFMARVNFPPNIATFKQFSFKVFS